MIKNINSKEGDESEIKTAIADDLTGANEIASVLNRNSKTSHVFLASGSLHISDQKKSEYVVYDLESRKAGGKEAYGLVLKCLNKIRDKGEVIYKKIDSTLRGNLVEELKATLDCGYFDLVVVVPAIPDFGRQTVGGYHLVNGKPLNETEYVKHSDQKVTTSHLPTYLSDKIESSKIGLIELNTVSEGWRKICRGFESNKEEEIKVIVCDSLTNENLRSISQAMKKSKLNILPVGSSGLFQCLYPEKKGVSQTEIEGKMSPTIVICGSLNNTSRNQIDYLRENNSKVEYFELKLEELKKHPEYDDKQTSKFDRITEGIKKGKNMILTTPSDPMRLSRKEEREIMNGLGKIARKIVVECDLAGMVLTGGDTAKSVIKALDVQSLKVIGELESLIPICRIEERNLKLRVVTKAGGYGSIETILKAVKVLRRGSNS